MSEMRQQRRVLRSIGAVIAGLLVIVITSIATDQVMHATGVFPPWDRQPMSDALWLLATAYRIVYGIVGCYIAERLAPGILRSIGAVLAGFLAVTIFHIGTNAVMRATGVFPPRGQPMSDALFLLDTAYRTVFTVAGSYITARLASDRPMRHALALGVVGLAVSIVGAVLTWDAWPGSGPHWYPLALIATALPCAWVGGRLREMQLRARADG
jgi:surface polysaccharide O-acyltransferase-like enzyme